MSDYPPGWDNPWATSGGEEHPPDPVPRRGQFEYAIALGTSWAACTICKRSVFTGGSGAEVEWWMEKHPARCPGPQGKPKMVRWQEDVFAK